MIKGNTGNPEQASRSRSQIIVLFIALIVFIMLLFANFAYLNTQSTYDKQYISHAGELRVLSQRIAKNATEAASGKAAAFKLLSDARNDFAQRWGYLKKGDPATGLPAAPPAVRNEMHAVQQDWENLLKNTDAILASEQTVLSLHQVAATLAETVPQLQVEYEKVVEILLQRGAPAAQVAMAQRQSLLAERILGAVNTVLAGDENSSQAAGCGPLRPGTQWHAAGQCRAEDFPGRRQGCPRPPRRDCRTLRVRFRLRRRDPRNLAGAVPGPRIRQQHLQPVADPAGRSLAPGQRVREPGGWALPRHHRRLCARSAGAGFDHSDRAGHGPRDQSPVARNGRKE